MKGWAQILMEFKCVLLPDREIQRKSQERDCLEGRQLGKQHFDHINPTVPWFPVKKRNASVAPSSPFFPLPHQQLFPWSALRSLADIPNYLIFTPDFQRESWAGRGDAHPWITPTSQKIWRIIGYVSLGAGSQNALNPWSASTGSWISSVNVFQHLWTSFNLSWDFKLLFLLIYPNFPKMGSFGWVMGWNSPIARSQLREFS